MKVLTAAEMREVDRATEERFGIPTAHLMVEAGESVTRFIEREYPEARHIAVVCGMGNNGGDGLVAAAALLRAGQQVQVLLLGRVADLKGDPRAMLGRLPEGTVREVPDEAAWKDASLRLGDADLLVDAMVGTGFKPPLRGLAAAVRDRFAELPAPVVAVDLPSGWDADSRAYAAEGAVRATAVVTFTAPKLAHVCGNLTGSAYGAVVVAPIGSPEEAVVSALGLHWSGSAKPLTEQPREADDNKGRHGHVLLFGGSHGKSGAPSMASLAALRAGAGLVTAAVAESILPTVALIAPELMTEPLTEDEHGEIAASNLEAAKWKKLTEKKTVLAAGPGLGQGDGAEALVWALVERTEGSAPLVLDADALNIVAKDMPRFAARPARDARPVVLTPHPGEMGRLANLSIPDVQKDREGLARRFAAEYGVTLVLKGWRTLIAHPAGELAINTTGNPGLAKGGSGDMLTGIVAAMVAQYPKQLEQAVEAAVYLHGLAADLAVRDQDEHTLLVTDVIASLWRAFRFRWRDKAGYIWLEGLPRCLKS